MFCCHLILRICVCVCVCAHVCTCQAQAKQTKRSSCQRHYGVLAGMVRWVEEIWSISAEWWFADKISIISHFRHSRTLGFFNIHWNTKTWERRDVVREKMVGKCAKWPASFQHEAACLFWSFFRLKISVWLLYFGACSAEVVDVAKRTCPLSLFLRLFLSFPFSLYFVCSLFGLVWFSWVRFSLLCLFFVCCVSLFVCVCVRGIRWVGRCNFIDLNWWFS